MSESKKRIHIVINPAAGKDEPILNTINDVFHEHGIDWGVSVTQKFGDATEFARQAAKEGFDIIAGYGGDGTQHEIANGLIGSKAMPMNWARPTNCVRRWNYCAQITRCDMWMLSKWKMAISSSGFM